MDTPTETVPGRIRRAKIRFLSLCPAGKTGLVGAYKGQGTEAGQPFVLQAACKGGPDMDEQGLLTAVVYAPEHTDEDGNWATAEDIKDIAHDYLRNGGHVDLIHDFDPLSNEQAAVVESFIIQEGDPRFADTPVDPTGGWGVVLQIDDPELRQNYRNGDWVGISMGGVMTVDPTDLAPEQAVAEKASDSDMRRKFRQMVKRLLSDTNQDPAQVRHMGLDIHVPPPGATDYDGRLISPSFHLTISGDI